MRIYLSKQGGQRMRIQELVKAIEELYFSGLPLNKLLEEAEELKELLEN